jgi:hypothetical protein
MRSGNQGRWNSIDQLKEKLQEISDLRFVLVIGIGTRLLYLLESWVAEIARGQSLSFRALCQWDCQPIKLIAIHSYDLVAPASGYPNWGYFPAYPVILKVSSFLSPFSIYANQFFLSSTLFISFLYVLNSYLTARYSRKIAIIAILLISISPVNIYLTTGYTESSYLFFSLLALYLLDRQRFLTGGFVGGLTLVSRGTGIFFLPLFVWKYFRNKKPLKSSALPAFTINLLSFILFLTIPLIAFSIYLGVRTGDFLAFYHVATVSHTGIRPFLDWPIRLIQTGSPTYIFDALTIAIGYLCSGYFLFKKNINEFFVMAPITLISSGATINFRYILTLYPVYLLYSIWLSKRDRRLIFISIALLACAEIFTIYQWVVGAPYLI